MKAVETSASTTARYPNIGRLEKVVTSVETMPVPGMKMMYTSGWPKNQNRCWNSSASPPRSTSKKCVATRRSRISAVLAIITAGIAKITMNDVTTCAQTKIGLRFSDMPGARSLNAVVMIDTATASDATSVHVIICAQTSGRLVGLNNCSDSGG